MTAFVIASALSPLFQLIGVGVTFVQLFNQLINKGTTFSRVCDLFKNIKKDNMNKQKIKIIIIKVVYRFNIFFCQQK